MTALPTGPADAITDVPGIRAGHWTGATARTGCTVVLAEDGAAAAVDVRGGAPGTRETALLGPGRTVDRVHAVLLTGGSAFGLAAADGVMRYLRERGAGFPTAAGPVPIVPAAVLYDLAVGQPDYPDAEAGYAACQAATVGPLARGRVGAGTGATVGKLFGPGSAMPGGFGTASARLAGGVLVGAVVAVNAVGDIWDLDGQRIIAGARAPDGTWLDAFASLGQAEDPRGPAVRPATTTGLNTTIGIIATNAPLDGSTASRLAQNAHDALARVIRPCHTPLDGDTIFVLSTRPGASGPEFLMRLSVVAEQTLARAIVGAVRPGY